MTYVFQLGSKVRHRFDDGWGSPGCIMACCDNRLRVFWPDENVFTNESPASLIPYYIVPSQLHEVAA